MKITCTEGVGASTAGRGREIAAGYLSGPPSWGRRVRAAARTKRMTVAVLALVLSILAGCSDSDNGCPLAEPYCGGDFPLNAQNTTQYGPPWTNVITQF
jgi:hypothetical protein